MGTDEFFSVMYICTGCTDTAIKRRRMEKAMTVRECYTIIGGDYEMIISRLKNDNQIARIAVMFLDEDCYGQLVKSMADKDYDRAFMAAHTLKGVCQNMAFIRLYESSSMITEALREKDFGFAERILLKVREDYQHTIDGIRRMNE